MSNPQSQPNDKQDRIDLRICQLMDSPPFGDGCSAREAAELLSREFPGERFNRNIVTGKWSRIKKALEV